MHTSHRAAFALLGGLKPSMCQSKWELISPSGSVFLLGQSFSHNFSTKVLTSPSGPQVRLIRKKMTDIMMREVSSSSLKEVVNKLLPDSIGKDIEKACQGIYPMHDVYIRKVKILKKPKFDGKLWSVQFCLLSKPSSPVADIWFCGALITVIQKEAGRATWGILSYLNVSSVQFRSRVPQTLVQPLGFFENSLRQGLVTAQDSIVLFVVGMNFWLHQTKPCLLNASREVIFRDAFAGEFVDFRILTSPQDLW